MAGCLYGRLRHVLNERRVPIDAETRGKLRLWKAGLATRYAYLDRLVSNNTLDDDASAIALRGSITGRQRAFDRIRRAILPSGAILEGLRLHGKHPIAAWSILRPRVGVAVDPDDPSYDQNCITVNYLLAGRLPGLQALAEGLWSLEIPDHATGRLLQRHTVADPSSLLYAAHHAALRLRQTDVAPSNKADRTFRFLIPAGPGAFSCSLIAASDRSLGYQMGTHIRAFTWLNDDQLRDDQTPVIDDGLPGGRLGDGWLLPAPLRAIAVEHGTANVHVWKPGMPETLSSPMGRA